jgi:mannosyltransferase OCH1-like enzyme
MIPKTIHYCWFGPNAKSELNKKCLDSWHRILPNYKIKECNESNSPLDSPYCQASFASGQWSRLSNYVRLHAVYNEGGVYLDTDMEVVKSLVPLMMHKCFLGFQQVEEQIDWVNSAILGATPGHQFLKHCLKLTEDIFTGTGEFCRSPTVVTKVLKEMGLSDYKYQQIEDVTVYPVDYFYPYPWFGKFSTDCLTENTYCIHHWEGTWVKRGRYAMVLARLRKLKKMMVHASTRWQQARSGMQGRSFWFL